MRAKFIDLARELGELGAWVRLHYVYPYPHVDEVIPLMADGKVLPYLDIPFQHAAPDVLKRMKRPGRAGEDARAHPPLARDLPGAHDPLDLHRRLSRARPTRISRCCSTGSTRRSSTASAASSTSRCGRGRQRSRGAVPDEVKEERWHRFMQRQQAISAQRLKAQGRHAPAGDHRRGRTDCRAKAARKADAPEIDGAVYVASRRPLRVGEIATVKIERADDYDLHGMAVGF